MKSECEGIKKEDIYPNMGCGSTYPPLWIFKIPKWISENIWCLCVCHDIKYSNGRTLEDKYEADDKLYDGIYYDAFHSPPHQKKFKILLAELVYWALSTKLSDIAYQKAKSLKFYFK